jgi:hypothetical protein
MTTFRPDERTVAGSRRAFARLESGRGRAAVAAALLALAVCAPAAVGASTAGQATVAAPAATASTPLNLPGTTSPFSPGVPVSPVTSSTSTTTPVITSTSTSGGGGLSGSDAILIAVGALVVLIGVSAFIWRDARRHAPVKQGADRLSLDSSRRTTKAAHKPRKLSPAERKRRRRGRAR